jgi:hypothetical protein
LALPGSVAAAVPFRAIVSGGPLTRIALGDDGSCQVAHASDARLELYPPSATPADCGTFVFTDGTLYAPDFPRHDSTAAGGIGPSTPFSAVSQRDAEGGGTAASPFRVVTVLDAGATGLRITQTDTYVVGEEGYRTTVAIRNVSASTRSGILYRAGDCYLQESDVGFGLVEGAGPGCAGNANNSPAGRIEQWFPLTPGSNYIEAGYSEVWAAIRAHVPFPNTCRCTEAVDNGAGLSWSFSVPAGGEATFSHLTVFSPTGVTGGQQPQSQPPPEPPGPPGPGEGGEPRRPLPPVFGPGGAVSAPSNRRCLSRRNFRIRVRRVRGLRYEQVIVFVNRRRVAVRRGRRVTARVDLRGLPLGRYTVTITLITTRGEVLRGVRRYRTCTPRQRGGRPPI